MEKHRWFGVLLIFLLAGCTGTPTPATSPTPSILILTPHFQTATPTYIPTKTASPYLPKSFVTQKREEEASPVASKAIEEVFPTQTLVPGKPWPERLYLYTDPGMLFYVDGTERGNSFWDPIHSILGSGGVAEVRFSNFADWMAYVDDNRNLMVSNLHGDAKTNILQLSQEPTPFELEMLWSPDDQHLLIDFPDDWKEQDMIYHVQENRIEPWPYRCDRLLLSPKTGQVAVGCLASKGTPYKIAVMEWGGQIWYQERVSAKVILPGPSDAVVGKNNLNLFPIYRLAGWTVDGESIAFFDIQEGSLKIMSSQGKVLKTIPDKAYFRSASFQAQKQLPGQPIQWTKSGSWILLFGKGTVSNPCPEQVFTEEYGGGHFIDSACWHVVNPASGQTVWTPPLDPFEFLNKSIGYEYGHASISSSGSSVTLSIWALGESCNLVFDLTANTTSETPFWSHSFRYGE